MKTVIGTKKKISILYILMPPPSCTLIIIILYFGTAMGGKMIRKCFAGKPSKPSWYVFTNISVNIDGFVFNVVFDFVFNCVRFYFERKISCKSFRKPEVLLELPSFQMLLISLLSLRWPRDPDDCFVIREREKKSFSRVPQTAERDFRSSPFFVFLVCGKNETLDTFVANRTDLMNRTGRAIKTGHCVCGKKSSVYLWIRLGGGGRETTFAGIYIPYSMWRSHERNGQRAGVPLYCFYAYNK